jgi:hypothetical protein
MEGRNCITGSSLFLFAPFVQQSDIVQSQAAPSFAIFEGWEFCSLPSTWIKPRNCCE